MATIDSTPKVSVIITSYNHGQYVAEAIDSVLHQSYQPIEIIVVDDGSTDNTRAVVNSFPDIKYIYQKNQGLSAARNTGIEASRGKYLVFLDADDWLYPEAIAINLNYLKRNKHCVFVSGAHDKVDQWGNKMEETQQVVNKNHYAALLRGNYIGMHATVMYQRAVFDEFKFDVNLKACEDYDLYLHISRKYPICSHEHKIAAYRIHDNNMSSDYAMMLENVLKVLKRQHSSVSRAEVSHWHDGLKIWKEYYGNKIIQSSGKRGTALKRSEIISLLKHQPKKLVRHLSALTYQKASREFKNNLPGPLQKLLHELGLHSTYVPAVGNVFRGDLDRLTPLSNDFGFDRGGAIDRFYIENFLSENREHVRGAVLEIGDNEYTMKYGKSLVRQSEILHVDSSNEKATFVGDITNVPQIPSGYFDCIILTQTLHLIYDFKKALETCYRILKPGGCLLLTVPGITPIDKGPWKDYWLWSFTDASMKKVMQDTFNGSQVEVKSHGNVHVASAFLYGLGLPEVSSKALQYNDPSYQVIVTVKAIKH